MSDLERYEWEDKNPYSVSESELSDTECAHLEARRLEYDIQKMDETHKPPRKKKKKRRRSQKSQQSQRSQQSQSQRSQRSKTLKTSQQSQRSVHPQKRRHQISQRSRPRKRQRRRRQRPMGSEFMDTEAGGPSDDDDESDESGEIDESDESDGTDEEDIEHVSEADDSEDDVKSGPVRPYDSDEEADQPASVEQLYRRWCQRRGGTAELLLREFGIDVSNPRVRYAHTYIEATYGKHMDEVTTHQILRGDNLSKAEKENLDTVRQMIFACYRIAVQCGIVNEVHLGGTAKTVEKRNTDLLRYERNNGKMKAFQTVFLQLLTLLHEGRYRRSKDGEFLYRPYVNSKGMRTVSYVRDMEVRKFIHTHCSPDRDMVRFKMLGASISVIETLIRETTDQRIPVLDVDEGIHGYENGYYDIREDHAFFYGDQDADMVGKKVSVQHHAGYKLKRDWFEGPFITTTREYCRFEVNPVHFDNEEDLDLDTISERFGFGFEDDRRVSLLHYKDRSFIQWPNNDDDLYPPLHIRTDAWDQVMNGQRWSLEKRIWMYGLCGRMLFPVGELDQYDIILAFSGETNAGKSTSLNAMKESFYPDVSRVGVLSSNKEEVFGLEPFIDKDAVICDEMEKKPKGWNVGELKTMASGGWISIARKNKTPVMIRWRAPLAVASNFMSPEWNDSAGAIARRFAVMHFGRTIEEKDATLRGRMNEEASAFLVKCVKSYHYLLATRGTADFSRIAPEEVGNVQRAMERSMSPFLRFLAESESVVLYSSLKHPPEDPRSFYCPMTALKDAYHDWRVEEDLSVKAVRSWWNEELYRRAFQRTGCTYTKLNEKPTKMYPRYESMHAGPRPAGRRDRYVYGVDLRKSIPPEELARMLMNDNGGGNDGNDGNDGDD